MPSAFLNRMDGLYGANRFDGKSITARAQDLVPKAGVFTKCKFPIDRILRQQRARRDASGQRSTGHDPRQNPMNNRFTLEVSHVPLPLYLGVGAHVSPLDLC